MIQEQAAHGAVGVFVSTPSGLFPLYNTLYNTVQGLIKVSAEEARLPVHSFQLQPHQDNVISSDRYNDKTPLRKINRGNHRFIQREYFSEK